MDSKTTYLVEHTCSQNHITTVSMVKEGKDFKYSSFANNLCREGLCDRITRITDNRILNKSFSILSFIQFVTWLFISPGLMLIEYLEKKKWE